MVWIQASMLQLPELTCHSDRGLRVNCSREGCEPPVHTCGGGLKITSPVMQIASAHKNLTVGEVNAQMQYNVVVWARHWPCLCCCRCCLHIKGRHIFSSHLGYTSHHGARTPRSAKPSYVPGEEVHKQISSPYVAYSNAPPSRDNWCDLEKNTVAYSRCCA